MDTDKLFSMEMASIDRMVEVLSAGSDRIDLYFSEKHHSNMENRLVTSRKNAKNYAEQLDCRRKFQLC